MVGAKGQEMRPVVTLKVRQLPTIKCLRHSEGKLWGQPPPAVRRSKAPQPFEC